MHERRGVKFAETGTGIGRVGVGVHERERACAARGNGILTTAKTFILLILEIFRFIVALE